MTRPIVLLVAVGLVAISPVLAMTVETSHKPGRDFSEYRTYAWKTRPGIDPNHPLAEGSLLDRMLKVAADSTLATKGFERTESGTPDLWVTYTGFVEDVLEIEGTRREITSGLTWIGTPYAHSTRAYKEGTLVIEILDARTEQLVWSGWAKDVASTREKLRKKAARAPKRILQHFPPQ